MLGRKKELDRRGDIGAGKGPFADLLSQGLLSGRIEHAMQCLISPYRWSVYISLAPKLDLARAIAELFIDAIEKLPARMVIEAVRRRFETVQGSRCIFAV